MMPNMTVMAPKNGRELEKMMEFAVHAAGPCAIRYPRGTAYQGLEDFESPIRYGKSEILYRGKDTAILSVGSMTEVCEQVYKEMKNRGEAPTFVNARFVKPIDTEVLDILLDVLASGIGSLTNPSKLANTFKSERQIGIGSETIEKYIGYFEESFLIEKAVRYDVKGRKYIGTPAKYYYTDLGLRNARLGFRQLEETHIMENVLYNDLIRRGMNVDVGVVEYNTKDADGKKIRKQLEVDFVVNQGGKRFYIQSALSIADPDKKEQEIESLKRIPDSFSKMVVVRDYLKPWQDENGITYVGIEQFLLNEELLK